MTPRPLLVARVALAGIAATALGLVAAAPASAHTNNLYTFLGNVDPQTFATMDRASGAVSALGTPSSVPVDEVLGAEVFDEVGTAVAADADADGFSVLGWNHSTGAVDVPVALFVTGETGPTQVLAISGLDTRLDGTLLTYAIYEEQISGGEFPTFEQFGVIATLDRGTGELTPIIDLTEYGLNGDDENWISFESIATDPSTGTTYGFMTSFEDRTPYFITLDIAAGTHSEPTLFAGSGFESGFIAGADFDGDGTLYFIYGNNDREVYELSKLGAPAGWAAEARTYIADAASNYPDYPLNELALTLEHTALAATGAEVPAGVLWLLGGTLAVVGAGVVVVTGRRRGDARG